MLLRPPAPLTDGRHLCVGRWGCSAHPHPISSSWQTAFIFPVSGALDGRIASELYMFVYLFLFIYQHIFPK